jgi:alkylhydroperoxidase/carboxymuconolactone decarboxylase family protein YurZ
MELSADLSAIATVSTAADSFGVAVVEEQILRASAALVANGFEVEILDGAYAARDRVLRLISRGPPCSPRQAKPYGCPGSRTGSINRLTAILFDCAYARWIENTRGADLRRLMATPDVVVGSVAAVTESGSVVVVSASGSQLPACAGGSGSAILIIGAQKIVLDIDRAFERVERYALPLETERALKAYGRPSAINKVLSIHREALGPRTRLLLLRENNPILNPSTPPSRRGLLSSTHSSQTKDRHMTRLPLTTLETARPAVRPLLEDIQRRSLAPDRLLNIHAQMANAPAVLAAYACMRRALEELSTLDVRTRSAIMLVASASNGSDYHIAIQVLLARRAGWTPTEISAMRDDTFDSDPRLARLFDVVRQATHNVGRVDEATWNAAVAAGWTDTQLAESFASITLATIVDAFARFAETPIDMPDTLPSGAPLRRAS